MSQKLRYERKLRGWSQADVAAKIGCDTKAVSRWERGEALPRPYFIQKLVELFNKDAKELGLMEIAQEQTIVSSDNFTVVSQPEQAATHENKEFPLIVSQDNVRQEDWGEAPHVGNFYGRENELTEVEQWIAEGHCRVVAVVGIGGVGKTSFALVVAKKVQAAFKCVFWRSLRNSPKVEHILESFFQFFPEQRSSDLPINIEEKISLLITLLREHRCLLILDNVESILQVGDGDGEYQEESKRYGRLFQRIGESYHASCLLLTSREKPKEVAHMEGTSSIVRSLQLSGIDDTNGRKLLKDKELLGSDEVWTTFVHLYSGNPLLLKIVSGLIREVFGGDIADFLREEKAVFGGTRELLDQQFHQLFKLEQHLMYWLAIEREAVSRQELWENMQHPLSKGALFDAMSSLRRRSLIEVGSDGRFTLQPVIMEYVTERFVENIYQEVSAESIILLGSHALVKAQSNDYVRESQVRFILAPLAARLLAAFEKAGCDRKFRYVLSTLRITSSLVSSYAAGNILNLLVQLQIDLRGFNFSHLAVEQAYLRGVALPDVDFTNANLAKSVFTDTFSNILCVALSPNGELLATGTTTGEVRLWHVSAIAPVLTFLGHTDGIRSIAFSPDGRTLVSGSEDATLRFWDTSDGRCLNILQGHASLVRSVAFSSNGQIVASGSEDRTVRIWNVSTGLCLHCMQGHTQWVRGVAFHPDGNTLASCSDDTTIRLWDASSGLCLRVLRGQKKHIRSVVFSNDGMFLAGGSEEQTVQIWNAHTGHSLKVLQGHTHRVRAVAFTSDSTILASCSDDATIRLWDASTGQCLKVLHGHVNRIWSIAFSSSSNVLVSASEDDTLRFWETRTGLCFRTLRGYTNLIKSVAFSPDGQMLASGNEDQDIRLWDVSTGQCLKTLQEHTNRVRIVIFSPDGRWLASGSEDETIRIWDVSTGHCIKTLGGHTHLVRSVAFNRDGSVIASSSHDTTVRLWDVNAGQCIKVLRGHNGLVWDVAFNADSKLLASGGEDTTVRLWDAETGQCINILYGHSQQVWSVSFSPIRNVLSSSGDDATVRVWDTETSQCINILRGHTSWVRCVAFSPNGNLLASCSHDLTVRLWDVSTGQCINIFHGHTHWIMSVTFSPDGCTIASGSDDGAIKIWDVSTGQCIKTLRSERPYERMNITDIRGLTESQKAMLKMLGAVENKH